MRTRCFRWLRRSALGLVALAVILALIVTFTLRASLPRVSGIAALHGLASDVRVDRDALGVPSITADSLLDAVRAQGFVHAQDRYFQMDLARRSAAGELAALIGIQGVGLDRANRLLQLRQVSTALLAGLSARHRAMLLAYAEGVNAGLNDLTVRPWEYLILRTKPEPWLPEDSLLVMFAMYDVLSNDCEFERPRGVLRDCAAEELFQFLAPDLTRFDTLMPGYETAKNSGTINSDYTPLPIPGPDIIDVRSSAASSSAASDQQRIASSRIVDDFAMLAIGSNAWAVAGSRTNDGRAILANDPHLPLRVPNVWYRCSLSWKSSDADIAAQAEESGGKSGGASLPGFPGIVIGSNAHIAFGVTNAYVDQEDWIIIEVDPADANRYLTPDGSEPFITTTETIHVAHGESQTITLRATRWGVVNGEDHHKRPLVKKWTALDPAMVNIDWLDIIEAKTLEEAIAVGGRWNGPTQNILIAEHTGRIGWTISGAIPKREGFDGRTPTSWADGTRRWNGLLGAADPARPRVIDPPSGVLFSANHRAMPREQARPLSGLWMMPDRAARIAELLAVSPMHDERSLAAMQLDTRSQLHDFYRDLVLDLIPADLPVPSEPDSIEAAIIELRRLVAAWNGTADADQPAFRILAAVRLAVRQAVIGPIIDTIGAVERSPGFQYNWPLAEEPVRRILEAPAAETAHLLPPHPVLGSVALPDETESRLIAAPWRPIVRSAIISVAINLIGDSEEPLAALRTSWGEANTTRIRHPFALSGPLAEGTLASIISALTNGGLNMPQSSQSGSASSVRVATSTFGASLRMVVAPGHERDGLFVMPCGQSGHVLSRHYNNMFEPWLRGEFGPLESDTVRSSLLLRP